MLFFSLGLNLDPCLFPDVRPFYMMYTLCGHQVIERALCHLNLSFFLEYLALEILIPRHATYLLHSIGILVLP